MYNIYGNDQQIQHINSSVHINLFIKSWFESLSWQAHVVNIHENPSV